MTGNARDLSQGLPTTLDDLECGSEEERELRGVWLTRVMFLQFVGGYEGRGYEEWLEAQGLRLV